MSLLREIQDAAIDSESDLASLLRKCKVLGARLGSEEFKCWVDAELAGYKKIEDYPSYRVLRVSSKGNFAGAFGSGMNNADIPLGCLPSQLRESMSRSYLGEPVAAIEALVKNSNGSFAQEPWDPDFLASISHNIYHDMNCLQAWKAVPITKLIAALDEIRNRILNFVLEIEAQDPAAGEAELNSMPVPPEKVHQIFNTFISGSVQNVATGSHSFEQKAKNNGVNIELFDQLLEALHSIGKTEITRPLTESVEEMRSTYGANDFKKHYQHFLSLLADHIQVLGPAVAPFLAPLAELAS